MIIAARKAFSLSSLVPLVSFVVILSPFPVLRALLVSVVNSSAHGRCSRFPDLLRALGVSVVNPAFSAGIARAATTKEFLDAAVRRT
jgi:hypothetical protein